MTCEFASLLSVIFTLCFGPRVGLNTPHYARNEASGNNIILETHHAQFEREINVNRCCGVAAFNNNLSGGEFAREDHLSSKCQVAICRLL